MVLLGSRNHLAAFEQIVADWLLYVHALPAWQAQIAASVPVIAGGDGQRIDTPVIHHAPQVLLEGRLFPGELFELRSALLQLGLIGIAESGDLYAGDLHGELQVIAAAPTQPEYGDADRLAPAKARAPMTEAALAATRFLRVMSGMK